VDVLNRVEFFIVSFAGQGMPPSGMKLHNVEFQLRIGL
jgi:hypothetical protein